MNGINQTQIDLHHNLLKSFNVYLEFQNDQELNSLISSGFDFLLFKIAELQEQISELEEKIELY